MTPSINLMHNNNLVCPYSRCTGHADSTIVSPPQLRVQVPPIWQSCGTIRSGLTVHYSWHGQPHHMLHHQKIFTFGLPDVSSITHHPPSSVTPDVGAGGGVSAGNSTLSTEICQVVINTQWSLIQEKMHFRLEKQKIFSHLKVTSKTQYCDYNSFVISFERYLA